MFHDTSWSVTGSTATLGIGTAHGLKVGDRVTVSGFPTTGSTKVGYLNVTANVTAATATTLSYAVASGHGGENGSQIGNIQVVSLASASADSGSTTVVSVPSTAASGTVTTTPQSVSLNSGWDSTHPPGIYCIPGDSTSTTLLTISMKWRRPERLHVLRPKDLRQCERHDADECAAGGRSASDNPRRLRHRSKSVHMQPRRQSFELRLVDYGQRQYRLGRHFRPDRQRLAGGRVGFDRQ